MKVYLDRCEPGDLPATIARALEWIDVRSVVAPGARVFIKPNLTWRTPTPGVTVTPHFLRALVEALLLLTPNITIGESEGGQACFQAEDAFEHHGLYDLERAFGVCVVNLSRQPHETVTTTVAGRPVTVSLPGLLLHETDVFVTVPVPKIHAMTRVSLGFKNQWGCLGDKMRVTQHPQFDRAIVAINKLLNPKLCVFDGTYFLDHTGPMMGEAVPMNMVIASTDIGAASIAACRVMRIDPMSVGHHRIALREGMFPAPAAPLAFNRAPEEFADRRFKLKRAPLNYVHLAAFRNPFLNRLFYDSAAADRLHEALWFVRRNRLVKRLLYGQYGAGEANRGGRAV